MRTFNIPTGSSILLLALATTGCNIVLGISDFKDADDGQGGNGTGAEGPGNGGNGGSTGPAMCDEDPCKLVAPQCGCEEGQGCTLDASLQNRVCGPAGMQMPNMGCDGSNPCVAGSFCNGGFCNPFCVDDSPCVPFEVYGSICALEFPGGDKMCSDPCDPTVDPNGCMSGSGCYLGETAAGAGFTACFPSNNVPDGSPCANIDDCSPGSGCYGAPGSCFHHCTVADGQPCPSLGLTCGGFNPSLSVSGIEYGVCQ